MNANMRISRRSSSGTTSSVGVLLKDVGSSGGSSDASDKGSFVVHWNTMRKRMSMRKRMRMRRAIVGKELRIRQRRTCPRASEKQSGRMHRNGHRHSARSLRS